MKTGFTLLLLSLLAASATASAEGSEPQVIATQVFERQPGAYAAFPNLYRDTQGNVILSYTARSQASHVNASGSSHAYRSADCGLSWKRIDAAPPPAVYATSTPGHYRQFASGGWRRTLNRNEIPAQAIVRTEGSVHFYAQGLFLLSSQDEGATWQREEIATPPHAALMNHNISAHLITQAGTYLAAMYIKPRATATDQVLIARQARNGPPEAVLVPKPTDAALGGNETALVQTPDGRIVAFIRPDPDKFNKLLMSTSDDDGKSWSKPQHTDLTGYPANAIPVGTDILLTTALRRAMPLSIRVHRLDGRTLAVKSQHTLAREISIRASDFGYPITVKCSHLHLTTFYRPHSDGGAEVVTLTWQ